MGQRLKNRLEYRGIMRNNYWGRPAGEVRSVPNIKTVKEKVSETSKENKIRSIVYLKKKKSQKSSLQDYLTEKVPSYKKGEKGKELCVNELFMAYLFTYLLTYLYNLDIVSDPKRLSDMG